MAMSERVGSIQLGSDPRAVLKDGKESLRFIQQCWLMLPGTLRGLPGNILGNYADQISDSIRRFSDHHMLSFSSKEAYDHMIQGKAAVLTDPKAEQVLGFAKLFEWKDSEGRVVGLEFGSLFIDPKIRKHHVAQYITEQLVAAKKAENHSNGQHIPIFAVVTSDNVASLKLFRRMKWKEVHPAAEETDGYNNYCINGVNIFEDWGKDSIIFVYED